MKKSAEQLIKEYGLIPYEKTITIPFSEYNELLKIKEEVVNKGKIMVTRSRGGCNTFVTTCFYTADEVVKNLTDESLKLHALLDEKNIEIRKYENLRWDIEQISKSFWKRLFYTPKFN